MTSREWRPLGLIAALCLLLGVITVVTTVRASRIGGVAAKSIPIGATEDYGRRLLAETPEYLGPDVADPKMRYTTGRLSCGSCHLGAGAEPGTLSLPESVHHYPRFQARVGTTTTIEDRVNECMSRSMNGRPLPKDSTEMIAIVSYIRTLGTEDAASGASHKKVVGEPAAFKTPARAADIAAGKRLLEEKCASCHGKDGSGLLAAANPIHGYVFPPLWGPDSFNSGAGMHRVLTAAKFIKARMPLGRADLTNDEAFDLSAYINSQPRPEMPNLDRDYPDRKTKPIDTGYGPFADPFPLAQHQFGPFAPIEAYYKAPKPAK
jgi:thiosulfate dehydrogenase